MENSLTAPAFQLQGRRLLQAEGVMTLLEYSKERVVLLCRNTKVIVRGEGLKVALLSQNRAVITGLICGFEFV